MALYTILSVDTLPECAAGQRHVTKASLLIDHTPGGVATIARLLDLQTQGARFVAAASEDPKAETPITLALCSCGLGHLIQPRGLVDEYPARGE